MKLKDKRTSKLIETEGCVVNGPGFTMSLETFAEQYEIVPEAEKPFEERMKIEADEDFGDMMISAIRYGLWRRTYITKMTADYIIPLVKRGAFSKRVLSVMDKDLSQYEKDRAYRLQDSEKNKWIVDDNCDYESWSSLHKAIKEQIKEAKNETQESQNRPNRQFHNK